MTQLFFANQNIHLLYTETITLLIGGFKGHANDFIYHRMTSKTLCLRLVTNRSLDPVEHLFGLCTWEQQTSQQFGHT